MMVDLYVFVGDARNRITLESAIKLLKREWIIQELEDHNHNQVHTARALGMHRNTLRKNMKALKIPLFREGQKQGRK